LKLRDILSDDEMQTILQIGGADTLKCILQAKLTISDGWLGALNEGRPYFRPLHIEMNNNGVNYYARGGFIWVENTNNCQ